MNDSYMKKKNGYLKINFDLDNSIQIIECMSCASETSKRAEKNILQYFLTYKRQKEKKEI